MSNITFELGGVTLNARATEFRELPQPIVADNITLQGHLRTDYTAYRRQWVISWHHLSESDYNALRAVWEAQFSTGMYQIFECPYYSINTTVRVDINEKDIQFDGCNIMGVTITLREELSIS